jgi:hypothetical protein
MSIERNIAILGSASHAARAAYACGRVATKGHKPPRIVSGSYSGGYNSGDPGLQGPEDSRLRNLADTNDHFDPNRVTCSDRMLEATKIQWAVLHIKNREVITHNAQNLYKSRLR